MSRFFKPPPDPWPEQVAPANPPPWTGRPRGTPLGVVVEDLLLARSDRAAVYVEYLDAYPQGFELAVRASTSVEYGELAREGDGSGPDPFGGHWPIAGERRDVLPNQLLRVGVRFADGRTATSIGGHDRPVDGPVIDALGGGGSGRRGAGQSCFHQGYWISPLPPSGLVSIVCEWPAVDIPVACQQIEAQAFFAAAEKAPAMFGDGHHVLNDGRAWSLGTSVDVAWINEGTSAGPTIACAIPPIFDAYCTLEVPPTYTAELAQHEIAVIELLAKQTPGQAWWLGYLDTGASDVVFPYARRTTIYQGYGYVLVEAGPQQAANWREKPFNWTLPELMFPADRSWLVSTMWDDAWSSIGGSRELVDAVLTHPTLGPNARRMSASKNI